MLPRNRNQTRKSKPEKKSGMEQTTNMKGMMKPINCSPKTCPRTRLGKMHKIGLATGPMHCSGRKKIIIFNGDDHILFTSHRMILKICSQMQENVSFLKFIHKLKQSSDFFLNIVVVKKLGNSKNYSEFQETFLRKHTIIFRSTPAVNS